MGLVTDVAGYLPAAWGRHENWMLSASRQNGVPSTLRAFLSLSPSESSCSRARFLLGLPSAFLAHLINQALR